MVKSEAKALIEAYAKQSGKPAEEVAAEIASIFGYQKSGIIIPTGEEPISPIIKAVLEAKKLEGEAAKAGVSTGNPMVQSILEIAVLMPLIKSISGDPQAQASSKQSDVFEMIRQNDEKWERRLEQIEAKAEKEALQRRLDGLERLISEGGGKKNDDVMEEMKGIRMQLEKEKEKRVEDAIASKAAEIAQLREDVAESLNAIRIQPPAKTSAEVLAEEMKNQRVIEDYMRSYGKSHGWSEERLSHELEEGKPVIQQLLADLTGKDGLLAKYLSNRPGTKPLQIEEPQIVLSCENCGQPSDNGTVYCNSCRIAAAEQQQKELQAPPAPVESEVRKAGEIPPDAGISNNGTDQATT